MAQQAQPALDRGEAVLQAGLHVIDGVLHGTELLLVLVGNGDVELVFEVHHQLDGIEAVGTQIVEERGLGGDLLGVHGQLALDDLVHLFLNRSHDDGPP